MDNPKSAIDALLEDEKQGPGLTVKPLTLGRYALLDALESPLISKKTSTRLINLIPTFYVMTQEWTDLAGYDTSNIEELKNKASVWAGDKDINDTARLVEEIIRKLGIMQKVSPESQEDSSRKKEAAAVQTAG